MTPGECKKVVFTDMLLIDVSRCKTEADLDAMAEDRKSGYASGVFKFPENQKAYDSLQIGWVTGDGIADMLIRKLNSPPPSDDRIAELNAEMNRSTT